MKKFSKLILESKNESRKMSPLTNPVDWDEIFEPLIEHIESNLKSKVQGPGTAVFGSKTKSLLDEFIDQVEEDYKSYFINEVSDGSQESFLQMFNINVDYRDILDCLDPLSDRTNEIDDYPEWEWGCFIIDFTKIKYRNIDELIEDIEDIHLKLKMLKVNYAIRIGLVSRNFDILDSNTNAGHLIRKNWSDSWGIKSEDINLFNKISIYIFNKETIQIGDFN